jgi:ABC-2 type transport system permease protein
MSTAMVARAPEAGISRWRVFLWSVRREIWENQGIYKVPLAVAGMIAIATVFNVVQLGSPLHVAPLDPMTKQPSADAPFIFAALLLMFSTMVVSVFYSVDALYGERRDRSVLFWKSMPVSDTTTVLAKVSIPMLVLPLVTFAVTLVTQAFMLMVGTLFARTGMSHLDLWTMWWGELFHMVAFHGIWWAPFWGWFLLASAWSRRAPLLTAVLPPLVIGFVEKIAFGSEHFARWVEFRFMGDMNGPPPSHPMSSSWLMPMTPWQLLTDVHLWTGFVMTAACLALAVYFRRQRGPA